MKKAIFLGVQENVNAVYSREIMQALEAELLFPYGAKTFTKAELPAYELQDVCFVFSTWGMCELSEEEISQFFPSLECVFYAAGSVQRFVRPFLNKNIHVFSAWAANAVPVSEYTLAQIILASKGYFSRLHPPGSGGVMSRKGRGNEMANFPGNYDITVGIIGAGMIGRMVAEKIQRVLEHIRILAFDPFLPAEKAAELGIELCDLRTLFEQSDVVTNHLANNPRTVGMLNGDLFSRMKPNAVFINTGRGAQVVEGDLIAALKAVPSRSALLDVTFPEPPEEGSELYTLKNVFLTPHIAGSLGNEVHRMGKYMLEEHRRYVQGQSVRYEVTADMLETMA